MPLTRKKNNAESPKPEKKQRVRIYDVTEANDIRYRGPLNYQHFQLLGWLCIVVTAAVLLLKLGARVDAGIAAEYASLSVILTEIASLSLPFLLIANFTQILNASEGYRKQLIKNAGAMLAIFAVSTLFTGRYLTGSLKMISEDPEDAEAFMDNLFHNSFPYGFLSFNIFVDLFLCTLVMLFLNYRPTRIFRGKSVIVFRLLALLPIAYEIGCMVLKVQASRGSVVLPVWSFPLLTVKPPMTFLLFLILAVFVKTRERRFRRRGKTHEDYQAFLKTRRNSRNFSIFLAVMLIVVSILDFVVLVFFSATESVLVYGVGQSAEVTAAPEGEPAPAVLSPAVPDQPDAAVESGSDEDAFSGLSEEEARAIQNAFRTAEAAGFGGSVYLFILAPLVLLFSYTRKPRFPRLSMFIPLAAIVLILFLFLEGVHQFIGILPINKINIREITEMLRELSAGSGV